MKYSSILLAKGGQTSYLGNIKCVQFLMSKKLESYGWVHQVTLHTAVFNELHGRKWLRNVEFVI